MDHGTMISVAISKYRRKKSITHLLKCLFKGRLFYLKHKVNECEILNLYIKCNFYNKEKRENKGHTYENLFSGFHIVLPVFILKIFCS